MDVAWIVGLCAVALAFQTAKDAKGAKETKGPSTPPQSGYARDDTNNNKGIAPRLAPLARVDSSHNADLAGNRVQHTYVQAIHAPADTVFAVIEPVAEVEWAPGFEYKWVYAREGEHANSGQEGDVFLTQHHSGLGSQGTAVWLISRRDFKERRIQFVRFIAEFQVTQIDVHVVPDGKQSKCEITYTYTALSAHGREQLKHMTREHYEVQMKEWEQQVNAYLGRR